jgi:hypothetical protein
MDSLHDREARSHLRLPYLRQIQAKVHASKLASPLLNLYIFNLSHNLHSAD